MNILIDGQTLHTAEINRGIGTYFKEMLEAMLRNDFVNSFYITVDDEKKLDCFSNYAQDKLISIKNQYFNPLYLINNNNIITANKIYSDTINIACNNQNIDVYWNANPLMDNVLLPTNNSKARFTATIHDLIPYAMQDIYFKMWNKDIINTYKTKMSVLKTYELLFPISKYTQDDVLKYLNIETSKQIITFEGVDSRFKPYPFPKIVINEQYILYIGGFDPRKNMFKAIDSFALFMKDYNAKKIDYKLYLVCGLDEEAKNKLLSYAKEKEIEKSLVLTGFVDDSKLLKIYQKARCFFFPSLYEGFGLPILEALASGLPIACANNSSLPEVAGKYAHYFNADSIDEMAEALQKTLNESNSLDERMNRYTYALQFIWEKPAKILLDGMLNLYTKSISSKKKKIAWVSPLPPQRSGISNYSKILLLAMKDKADIDIYYDDIYPEKELKKQFKILPLSKLAKKFTNYDEVIYHLGNNTEFHTNIYKYAWNYPSTVVIHDWNIHPFMQHSFLHTKEEHYYNEAIKIYGKDGITELKNIKNIGYPDVWKFPMSDAIAKKSKRVIVHHQWVKEQFIEKNNVEVIPLFSFIEQKISKKNINDFKFKFSIKENEFMIVMFGDINKNKLPDIQIKAIQSLIDKGYPIKLVFAGKVQADTEILFDELKGSLYEKCIIATGYLSDIEYLSCLYASNLIINLRNPSMGEASLTLAEAFYAKKAVITGNLNQYKEFPDEIVAGKINFDGKEVEQLTSILKVTMENKNKRFLIQKNAKNYANNVLALDKIIQTYLG